VTSPTAAAAGVREEIDRIVSVLSGRHGELAEAMVENIKAEIPPYLRTADAAVLEDVLAHCERHAELILAVARQAREPLRAELAFAREAGVRRVRQGIPIDGLLAAFRVGHRTVWDAILEEADDGTVGREAAIALARPAMEYIDIASTQVAEAYTREEAKLNAAADRERRDLIESLLAGLVPPSIPPRVAPGLDLESRFIVAVAAPAGEGSSGDGLPRAAEAISVQATATRGATLVVVRQGQVVALVGTSRGGAAAALARLREARRDLAEQADTDLRMGVGTECAGLEGVAHGFAEAARALGRTTAEQPVLALQEMSAFDYLVASAEPGTREVVLGKGRLLLEADEREGGAVCETLLAYLACDLNVKRAAEVLTVHPNTVRYRMRRIAELTDADPRCFSDLLELVTVVRMARA